MLLGFCFVYLRLFAFFEGWVGIFLIYFFIVNAAKIFAERFPTHETPYHVADADEKHHIGICTFGEE